MKTAALVSSDPVLTAALQGAAALHGVMLAVASPGAGVGGPLLRQEGQALYCHPDGLEAPPTVFGLPARLGAVLDWLLHQQQRVPAVELGATGRLEAQARRLVRPDGTALPLTEKEAAIIACLAEAMAPVPRERLLAMVWGYNPEVDTHTLETHVYRLRQKLEEAEISGFLLSGDAGYYLAGLG